MPVASRTVSYRHGETVLEGYFAFDASASHPRPGVLISHTWAGRDEFVCGKARRLAESGYAAFALDMYGNGKLGSGPEENARLIQPFIADRGLLQARMLSALDAIRSQPEVDGERVAAMGFCFGGLCVLDLARSGVDIRGVVSFHGLFSAPEGVAKRPIRAKVLALHGYDDPMVSPEQVQALAAELTEAGADWQIHMYGHTVHAFTNPAANDRSFGTVYDAAADARSWVSLQNFLSELLD